MQIACTILSFVAFPPLVYFSTLPYKRHNFRKKVTEHKICLFIFSTTFETFPILRKIQQAVIKNAYWFSCQHSLFLSDFNEKNYFNMVLKKYSNIKFHGNISVGAYFLHEDGRTDGQDRHDKDNCRFSKFFLRAKKTALFTRSLFRYL
jgi:hypothetical protein